MSEYNLKDFVDECRLRIDESECPADCVEKIAPSMSRLLNGDTSFLESQHFRSDPEHYARNAIYIDEAGSLSLYALVWLPGQWTPIHDHGTWGVVGVLEGMLEERSYMRIDQSGKDALSGVELARGGVIMLSPGAVTSFVPNPDHIHVTGNADPSRRVVSLHLYGRTLSGFHIYDGNSGTRKWIEVSHYES